MSKKLLQLLTTALLMAIAFWDSPCHANVCYCWCGTKNNNYLGYYSFESTCGADCYNNYHSQYYCCEYNGCPINAVKTAVKGGVKSNNTGAIRVFDPSKSTPVGSEKTKVPSKSPIKNSVK